MEFQTPSGLRKGQTLFNFLEWLRIEKDLYPHGERLSDTFFIEDDELDEYYVEFLNKHS